MMGKQIKCTCYALKHNLLRLVLNTVNWILENLPQDDISWILFVETPKLIKLGIRLSVKKALNSWKGALSRWSSVQELQRSTPGRSWSTIFIKGQRVRKQQTRKLRTQVKKLSRKLQGFLEKRGHFRLSEGTEQMWCYRDKHDSEFNMLLCFFRSSNL